MPWRSVSRLREASDEVAAFVGSRPDDLVFVSNVTTGTNAVLGSVPLAPGDDVVVTDLAYGAVTLAAAAVCERAGATLRTVHVEYPFREPASRRTDRRDADAAHQARRRRPRHGANRARVAGRRDREGVSDAGSAGSGGRRACAGRARARHQRARRRLVCRQPAQVGARAARLRDSLGRAGSAGDAPLSDRLVGTQPGLPPRVRAHCDGGSDELPRRARRHCLAAGVGLRRVRGVHARAGLQAAGMLTDAGARSSRSRPP